MPAVLVGLAEAQAAGKRLSLDRAQEWRWGNSTPSRGYLNFVVLDASSF